MLSCSNLELSGPEYLMTLGDIRLAQSMHFVNEETEAREVTRTSSPRSKA